MNAIMDHLYKEIKNSEKPHKKGGPETVLNGN